MDNVKTLFFIVILLTSYSVSSLASTHQTDDLDSSPLSATQRQQLDSIWLENQQLSTHAHDALDFIAASAHHGLSPNHYHHDRLKQFTLSADFTSSSQFSQLLTDGLLKLISDISIGQFKSSVVDPEWFIPQRKINPIAFLQQAVLQPHFKSQLNALSPDTPEYHALTQALSRYQSYVDRGGWLQIDTMPLTIQGDSHTQIPAIRSRLSIEYDLSLSTDKKVTFYDKQLEQVVIHFQKKHGLKTDGIIGYKTRKAMNVSAPERVQQIKVSLERLRWMPKDLGSRYLMINVANYTLTAISEGDEKLNMRVIVGRKSRQTPSFSATLNHLVFNPYWNVPKKLARLDLLPKQQADLNYFYLNDIRVFTTENGHKVEHEPYTIDWQSVNSTNFPYFFRQDPGEHNALGKLKFMFQNPWGIYLHDTAHKELFEQDMRSLSSGCIRVEDPIALANFSLTTTPKERVLELIENKENKGLKLRKSLSLYAVYFTVWSEKGEVYFSPDLYQRNQLLSKLL